MSHTAPDRPLSADVPSPSERPVSPTRDDNASEYVDKDVLQALRNRDPAAVERWVYSQRSLLFGFLLKKVTDEDVARELLQETFYQALRSLPRFRGASKVSTWLCSIAENLARKHFRTKGRHATLEPQVLDRLATDGSTPSATAPSPNPRVHAERSDRKDMIHSALREMPESYRQIIRLRDLQERSTQETADALNLTRVNVRVRLYRARKHLKSLLDPLLSAAPHRAG